MCLLGASTGRKPAEETELAILRFCWHTKLANTVCSEQASRNGREDPVNLTLETEKTPPQGHDTFGEFISLFCWISEHGAP